jgi:hypothetical protein
MASENLKTTAITNLDATPPVRTTNYGQRLQAGYGSLTATTGTTTGSVYQMYRLPSNAILYSILMWLDATVTTFTGDVTLYYSDTWADGTDADAGTGLVAAHIFQTAYAFASETSPQELFLGGNVKGASLGQPLWQIAGLASDPGGFFDLVIVTTTTTSGAPVINCQVKYGNA